MTKTPNQHTVRVLRSKDLSCCAWIVRIDSDRASDYETNDIEDAVGTAEQIKTFLLQGNPLAVVDVTLDRTAQNHINHARGVLKTRVVFK